jgi:hypothetical protein
MNLVRVAEGIFSILLRLFPVEFLEEFGEEMRADFHQSMEDSRQTGGGSAFGGFSSRTA